ncbi:efflux RND transporter periplasmic adaptor subunit [Thalassotalea eurytherma]|uniref:Hemolysin D n=1 Tax=Thalassotalea eurytherma TaxID=1144278 RepID=A0ABQ6H2W5_9GAMM|nr:efflux RND transporter periplasmic adaptor subunit [Thalassotalea eurytherma]GLX80766.1 hemolysin D [Thalassotalea eurytherma]
MKVLITIMAVILFLPNSSIANERKSPPANVILENMSFQPIQVSIETVGTAEAQKSVSLFPATSDRVTQVAFQPGDYVEKGSVLLELDARRQLAALRRAKIELADQQRDVDRLIKSHVNGAVTESELDEANALLDLAKIAVTEAQADLDDRKVVAPFSGFVGLTEVEVGDRINQSTLITTIDDRAQLFINFSVPESAYSLVDQDTSVEVQPWNNRSASFNASLSQLDSRIDAQNRTLKVRAVLDNSDDLFRPGLSFKVSLNAKGAVYPVVPEAALAWGATGSYIWLAKDGKAVKKAVSIKQRLRGFILVEGDFANDDVLIVEGIQRLREGAEVVAASALAVKD